MEARTAERGAMRPWLLLGLAVILASCGDPGTLGSTGQPLPPSNPPKAFPPSGATSTTVMTRNIYVGAPVEPILAAPSPEAIPRLVAEAYRTLLATRFPERAGALADEIAATRPQLVGLQEVSLIRKQSPGDFFEGNPRPATEVVFDYLALLLAQLEARDQDYVVAAIQQNFDIELPSETGDDIRLTDYDVILARRGVETSNPRGAHYAARLTVPVGGRGGPVIEIPRGWISVDANVGGVAWRFVTTHLESEAPSVQVAQARELIQALRGEPRDLLLTGDFNSAADGSTTATYGLLANEGRFVDAWRQAQRHDPGFTCCQEGDLRNPTSLLSQRIDLVLVRPNESDRGQLLGGVLATRVGADPADRTPSGLWPSDHAGVVVTFHLAPPGVARR